MPRGKCEFKTMNMLDVNSNSDKISDLNDIGDAINKGFSEISEDMEIKGSKLRKVGEYFLEKPVKHSVLGGSVSGTIGGARLGSGISDEDTKEDRIKKIERGAIAGAIGGGLIGHAGPKIMRSSASKLGIFNTGLLGGALSGVVDRRVINKKDKGFSELSDEIIINKGIMQNVGNFIKRDVFQPIKNDLQRAKDISKKNKIPEQIDLFGKNPKTMKVNQPTSEDIKIPGPSQPSLFEKPKIGIGPQATDKAGKTHLEMSSSKPIDESNKMSKVGKLAAGGTLLGTGYLIGKPSESTAEEVAKRIKEQKGFGSEVVVNKGLGKKLAVIANRGIILPVKSDYRKMSRNLGRKPTVLEFAKANKKKIGIGLAIGADQASERYGNDIAEGIQNMISELSSN